MTCATFHHSLFVSLFSFPLNLPFTQNGVLHGELHRKHILSHSPTSEHVFYGITKKKKAASIYLSHRIFISYSWRISLNISYQKHLTSPFKSNYTLKRHWDFQLNILLVLCVPVKQLWWIQKWPLKTASGVSVAFGITVLAADPLSFLSCELEPKWTRFMWVRVSHIIPVQTYITLSVYNLTTKTKRYNV